MGLKIALAALAASASVIVLNGFMPRTTTQDEKEDRAKLMAKYQEAGKPGEQHQQLASCAGTWDQKFEKVGTPGSSSGTVTYRAILGGRFLVGESKGTMSEPGANGHGKEMPWEGFQIIGYDNVSKQFQSVWCDSMGTGLYMSTGTADPAGTVTLEGTMKDVLTPQGRPFKVVVKKEGDDKRTIELWDAKDGKTLVKEGIITETRQK